MGYFPAVRATAVADPVMNGSPARAISGPTASTSWLPAGPATATIFEFEVNSWVTVVAWAGFSWVSPCTIEIFVLLAALSWLTASSAKCSCSCPRLATGPVSGPSMPIEATQDLVLAAAAAACAAAAAAASAGRHGQGTECRRGDHDRSFHGTSLHLYVIFHVVNL